MILFSIYSKLVSRLALLAVLLAALGLVAGCASQQDTPTGAVKLPPIDGPADPGNPGDIEQPPEQLDVLVDQPLRSDDNRINPPRQIVGNLPSTNETEGKASDTDEQMVDSGRQENASVPLATTLPSRVRENDFRLAGKSRREAAVVDSALVSQCCHPPHPHHPPVPPVRHPSEPLDRENYAHVADNPIKRVIENPVSTFSIDVDTGGYSNVRRFLNEGRLPHEDAVRVEELINYFSYNYAVPRSTSTPFSVNTEVAPAPWAEDKLLMQIGIKGYEVDAAERKPANLVFLIDVSGSMRDPNKLGLLQQSLTMLTRQLTREDRIAIAVYAGSSGVVLESTPGNHHRRIISAINRLRAGGSTNGASGIRLAYDLANEGYVEGGINRIMLATDGDFNVGTVNFESLIDLAERKRETGVSLTTLGFGTGNYNDHLMEQLADAGNGNYAYIDSLQEGRKVLVDELSATLQTIAKDVKIQVEFNPATVAEYRLIGYENRALRREDFNNDKIDAGEIGAGHTVTALYEITLADSDARQIDALRYGRDVAKPRGKGGELAFVRLRYKAPDGNRSKLIEQPVRGKQIRTARNMSSELRFAAAVAGFGQLLKGGDYLGDFTYADVQQLARSSRGEDPNGYRGEFFNLVRIAEGLADVEPRQARR